MRVARPRIPPVARISVLVVVAAAVIALSATAAGAHAQLERSDPADGDVLARAPSSISLNFTEPPDPDLSTVDVLASDGSSVAADPAEPDGRLGLAVPLQPLPEGAYTVSWRTTSETDSHTIAGAFTFGVGRLTEALPESPAGTATPRPSPLAVAGRWLLYAGLALLVATATARALVVRGPLPRERTVLPLAWAAAAAGIVCIALAQADAAQVSMGTLLGSTTGGPLVRQGIAVLVTGIAVAAAAARRDRTTALVVGASASVALLFHTLAGHANAEGTWRWFDVAVQWAHVVAVGVWIGGLVWLLVAVRPGVRGAEPQMRRYSAVASIAIAAVLVSGVLRSIDLLGGWDHLGRLVSTDWGTALLVKLALFAALAGLAAVNRLVNIRRIESGAGRRALRRFVVAEIVLAAAIFGVTGILAGLPPASTAVNRATSLPAAVVVRGADFATTTRATLTVTPGTPGPNRFEVRLADYDTGATVDPSRVALRIEPTSLADVGHSTVELEERGGVWSAGSAAISIEGGWSVVVLAQTTGGGVEIPLRLRTRAPQGLEPRPTRSVSVLPGQERLPDLVTISLSSGESVQAYVDPAEPGEAEVHFTAFDALGQELPLPAARSVATSPTGAKRPLELDRLSPGHFVGTVRLTAGTWSFSLAAETGDEASLRVAFDQEVG